MTNVLFYIAFFLLTGAALSASDTAWSQVLHLGSISNEPGAEIKKFAPLAAYLEKELRSEGIERVHVVIMGSLADMATGLRDKKVDLYIDSPFPVVAVSRATGSKLMLRRWKKGVSEYHSIIFTKRTNGVLRLEDLQGKLIAFQEPFSSTGYFFPKTVLLEKGMKVLPQGKAADPAAVTYIFSEADENTMAWVLRDKVVAGAMDNEKFMTQARREMDSLRVLHRSIPVPRQIVSHRAGLPPALVSSIKQLLVGMDQTDDGRKTLLDFEKTTKFDEIPERSLDPLEKARRFVDAELGFK